MKQDWLNLETKGQDVPALLGRLDASPFDELFEIDTANDRVRVVYHVEGKYFVPIMNGNWIELSRYCADHMVHPQDRAVYQALMDPETLAPRLESSRGVLQDEFRFRAVDGSWLWVRQVVVGGSRSGLREGVVRCYVYDINVQKLREQGLITSSVSSSVVARRDELTGLLADREFFTMAQRRLPSLSGQWCVVAVEIENFKLFSDWYGQQVGQFLLAGIGEAFHRVEQETGGVAGYRGQDNFALLIPYDIKRINALYDELLGLITAQGDALGFLPIFGICLIERPDEEIMEAFNRAALTAEQIKGDFRNRIRVYNPSVQEKSTEEYRILSRFQRALDDGEIFFTLQPQCRVSTGKVVGAESLARWRMPNGRMIPPARFVPILEKYGMVTNLDRFIWEAVCRWLRGWLDAGQRAVPVSVNVSQIDVFSIDVPACFAALLEKYSLPASLIKIEITESAYVEDTAVVRDTVRRLREQGFVVLMDDFGSGYSSLNMLHSLNVDVIKLDAQFLHIGENETRRGLNILESIVSMAKTMSIPTIVEGVETQEQINFLSDLGCRYMQGYYFYRPMLVDEFEALIRDGSHMDQNGFEFKANEEFHTREFLDENVVSDVMLNNILGAVAIYRWDGDMRVDIVRYNQQFYLQAGLEISQLEARRTDILQYFFPEDADVMLKAMKHAAADRLNGARGVVRVYKPNGMLFWMSMQLYFIEQNEQGMLFYGATRDVTELQYVNTELPGGYTRCAADGSYAFYYISKGFEDLTGFTAREIRERFDNRFINMVHRDDQPLLAQRLDAIRRGMPPSGKPYRIKRKNGGYVYIVNQSRLIEMNDQVCLQNVAVDVTEVMKLRNQMRLLSRFSSDDVVFVRHKGDSYKYRVVIHGLESRMGLSGKEFEKLLNSGELYRSMPPDEAARLGEVTMAALENKQPFEFDFTVTLNGRPLRLHMKNDHVDDKGSKVEYICTFREA